MTQALTKFQKSLDELLESGDGALMSDEARAAVLKRTQSHFARRKDEINAALLNAGEGGRSRQRRRKDDEEEEQEQAGSEEEEESEEESLHEVVPGCCCGVLAETEECWMPVWPIKVTSLSVPGSACGFHTNLAKTERI